MAKNNKVGPEVQEQLELLIQTMVDKGVVSRVAPEPIYTQYGLQGRVAVGQTAEEIHYDPARVDEFITKTFREFHLDYLKDQVASFPSNPSLEGLSEIVNMLSLGESVVAAMNDLSDTPQRKFVAYNSKVAQWPTVLSAEYTSLRDDLSLQLSDVIEMSLFGVEEDSVEVRQERLGLLMPLYNLARESNVAILSEAGDKIKFWDKVELVTPDEDSSIDKIWGLAPEPEYRAIACQSYLKSLKEDWGGAAIIAFIRGCDPKCTRDLDGLPFPDGVSHGFTQYTSHVWLDTLILFVTTKVVLDLCSVGASLYHGKMDSRERKKEIARYAFEIGSEYTNSASTLNRIAYTRTLGFLLGHPDEFVSAETLARQVFPVIYSGEEPVRRVHKEVVGGIVNEIVSLESGMVIESVKDDGIKYRLRKPESISPTTLSE